MNKKLFPVFIFIIFILVSCVTPVGNSDDPADNPNPDNPNEPVSGEELIPISIGSQWTYKFISSSTEEEHVYKVTGNFPFAVGEKIFSVKKFSGPIDSQSLLLSNSTRGFYNSTEGFHIVLEDNPGELYSSLWFKYPCNKGDTYKDITVNSIKDSVANTYLNQTFECIHYISDSGMFRHEYFISPGLGIVKALLFNESITYELTGYVIK